VNSQVATIESPTYSLTAPATARHRLVSLDVLRGIAVALMILVNNAGDGRVSFAQLKHSVWNGCTLTDLVFPNFLFIVGASIVLAFRNRRERGITRQMILLKVVRRAVLIFAIGLLLNAMPGFHLADLRSYGVLQRIALCYLASSMVYLAGGLWASFVACVVSVVGYWWLMTRVPMPEFGLPGVSVPVLDRTGNLAALLDRMLVPPAHLYHHGAYDPEGLLSTLPAIGTTLLGVLAISWLMSRNAPAIKAKGLLAAGVKRGLRPWIALGTNALAAYILSELLAIVLAAIPVTQGRNLQQFLFDLLPHWLGPPALVSMWYSILFVVVCTLPVLELYRRRIFVKV
jgi:predicted acyltransferase